MKKKMKHPNTQLYHLIFPIISSHFTLSHIRSAPSSQVTKLNGIRSEAESIGRTKEMHVRIIFIQLREIKG